MLLKTNISKLKFLIIFFLYQGLLITYEINYNDDDSGNQSSWLIGVCPSEASIKIGL